MDVPFHTHPQFGKYLQSQRTEWMSQYYINYKGLKKIINAKTTRLKEGESDTLKDAKTAFFFALERELEKVNAFYIQKEAQLSSRLRTLVEKKNRLFFVPLANESASEDDVGDKIYNYTSLSSLREAFSHFQHDLEKVQRFVELNFEGFRKILKKWDKRSKSATKELYLSRQVDVQPCFNSEVLAELTDTAVTHFTELDGLLHSHAAIMASGGADEIVTLHEKDTEKLENALTKAIFKSNIMGIHSVVGQLAALESPHLNEFLSQTLLRAIKESTEDICHELVSAASKHSNLLLQFNAKEDISLRTCLHDASLTGKIAMLNLCLSNPATDIHALDVYGRNALHYAAMHGHLECLRELILAGCDINASDYEYATPLVCAIKEGRAASVNILLESGALFDPITASSPIAVSLACEYGMYDICALLLQKGAALKVNAEGLFPLHISCRQGHSELTLLLLRHGAQVEELDQIHSWTPLFYSASEGHTSCTRILLEAGARVDVADDVGWFPCTYAVYKGHMQQSDLLRIDNSISISPAAHSVVSLQASTPLLVSNPLSSSDLLEMGDLDDLTPLSLPPPILPVRIYGHNYLSDRTRVHISFGNLRNSMSHIQLFDSKISSLKLIISQKPDHSIPYAVILPAKDETEIYSFLVQDLSQFCIQFDVYQAFGNKVIAKAVALSSQLENATSLSSSGAGEPVSVICPLFDVHLRVVGQLDFFFSIIKPFSHPGLVIGGETETYWKATQNLTSTAMATAAAASCSVQSFITATSLASEYIMLVIQITKDGIPVVFKGAHLTVGGDALTLQLSPATLTFDQCTRIFALNEPKKLKHRLQFFNNDQSANDIASCIYEGFWSLEALLKELPEHVGVNITLKYPSSCQNESTSNAQPSVHSFVDSILKIVYDNPMKRAIIFSSFNADICLHLNWKQPNYGVLFGTSCEMAVTTSHAYADGSNMGASIKEAIRFAKSSNLLGIICEATPLIQLPILIQTIKKSGLLLASYGTSNQAPENVHLQVQCQVDAIISNDVFLYYTQHASA